LTAILSGSDRDLARPRSAKLNDLEELPAAQNELTNFVRSMPICVPTTIRHQRHAALWRWICRSWKPSSKNPS